MCKELVDNWEFDTYWVFDAVKDLNAASTAVLVLALLEPFFDLFHGSCSLP